MLYPDSLNTFTWELVSSYFEQHPTAMSLSHQMDFAEVVQQKLFDDYNLCRIEDVIANTLCQYADRYNLRI